ncbi:MAG: hypothetical protein ABW360_05505 [Phenylobacterium sp.]
MSEPNTPAKDGGLKQPPVPQPSDAGVDKTGGAPREPRNVDEDSPGGQDSGGREGGMIGEG